MRVLPCSPLGLGPLAKFLRADATDRTSDGWRGEEKAQRTAGSVLKFEGAHEKREQIGLGLLKVLN